MDFNDINYLTGFANGDKFEDEEEVYDYFTMENMRGMFSGSELTNLTPQKLLRFAEIVIKNKWHME